MSEPICGIYLIENKLTGQKYVGQSINIHRRWRKHCSPSNNHCSYIDSSISKYGEDNFKLTILEELPKDQVLLNEREVHWIKEFNTFKDKFHYNLTGGGKSVFGENHPMYGKHHSEKTKQKLSGLNKGKIISESTRQKFRERKGEKHPSYNKSFSDDIRLRMSKSRNKTGYYRVSKFNDKNLRQGFGYRYDYNDSTGKHKTICCVNLDGLKEKVLEKGLLWYKF